MLLGSGWFFLWACFLISPVLAKAEDLSGKDLPTEKVARVLSGDTLELKSGEIVRLLGVEASKLKNSLENRKRAKDVGADPARYDKYAKRSKKLLEQLVGRKDVVLVKDSLHESSGYKDRQGRTLAYVYGRSRKESYVGYSQALWIRSYEKLEDRKQHLNVNATMIQTGYAAVDVTYPFGKRQEFDRWQSEAKKNKRGLWGEDISFWSF